MASNSIKVIYPMPLPIIIGTSKNPPCESSKIVKNKSMQTEQIPS